MKWTWTLFLIPLPALALELPKPIHSCVAPAYAIRIFPAEAATNRLEIRGANLSLLVFPARPLLPSHDKLHFPIGRPLFECASISPDGSDYLETIRVYDGFVHILKSVPGASFAPIQYEIQERRAF